MQRLILQAVLAAPFMVASMVYWWLVVRGQKRFRSWVEQHYGVSLTTGLRGHWHAQGPGSKMRLFAIECLQFVYFMPGFVVWSMALILFLLVLKLIEGT